MKIIIPALIISMILVCSDLTAQDEPSLIRNRAIGMVPQYALINGFRIDLDQRLVKNKPQWLIISPQVYLASDEPELWDYNSMWGLGLELQHRYYLKPDIIQPQGAYMAYGPSFHYFSIEDERLYSEKTIENGIEYTVVRYGNITTDVFKMGLTAHAGYQFLVSDVLYFDFYVGAGIRLSFDNLEPPGLHKIYNDWWGDYGYSGTLMTLGIRIGLLY